MRGAFLPADTGLEDGALGASSPTHPMRGCLLGASAGSCSTTAGGATLVGASSLELGAPEATMCAVRGATARRKWRLGGTERWDRETDRDVLTLGECARCGDLVSLSMHVL